MRVTAVRIRITPHQNRYPIILAYVSITLDDCLVINEAKLIKTAVQEFLCMPDREIKDTCPECTHRTSLRARFCESCGFQLVESERKKIINSNTGKRQFFIDVVHPIEPLLRQHCNEIVLRAYQAVLGAGFNNADVFVGADGTLRVEKKEPSLIS